MRKFLPLIGLLIYFTSSAQQKDTVNVNSTLAHATVYYGYGAELMHQSKTKLGTGYQEVIINDLALQVDANTIQITCPENVTILSFYHRVYTPKQVSVVSSYELRAADSIKSLQKQLAVITNEYNSNEDILKRITSLIETNFINEKKDISSAELIRLADYYTERVKLIKASLFNLDLKRIEINENILAITTRINSYIASSKAESIPKSIGQLIMQVMTTVPTTADFDIAYFTKNAGWIPTYELRMKTIDNSLKLVYKASVSQTTGLDWKKVKLSLSTGNPNQGTTVPVLTTSMIQLYAPAVYQSMQKVSEDLQGKVPGLAMDEIVTTGLGIQRKDKSIGYSTTKVKVEDFVTLNESQLNVNFDIDLPYDILSNAQAQTVSIKEESLPALFKHFAVPKLDKDAFLVARLSSWDSLNLMPGVANIIMDNVYLGKSFINPNTTDDTLDISMGRDKRIAITRTQVKDFTSTKTRGDSKIETHTFEIIVKNNKKQAVEISIKDHFPVSKVKEVEVVLMDAPGAEKDMETGMLTWNVKLKPGQTVKLRFSFTVKYPKDKVLQYTN